MNLPGLHHNLAGDEIPTDPRGVGSRVGRRLALRAARDSSNFRSPLAPPAPLPGPGRGIFTNPQLP